MKLTIRIYMVPDSDFQVDAEPTDTIGDLKAKIQVAQGHDAESLNIIFCGHGLDNDRTLESCSISEKGFVLMSFSKPPPELPIPREMTVLEYLELTEEQVAEWLGTETLTSALEHRTTSAPDGETDESAPKYKLQPLTPFDEALTKEYVPPLSYVSTYKYKPLSERIPGPHAAPLSDPPTTSGSTSSYQPISTSLFGAESTSTPVPPLSYVSTYKYRPLSERIPGPHAAPLSDPPTTSESASTYKPMSTSLFGAESTSTPVPPLSYVSTYKYRPLSERIPGSHAASSSDPPTASESASTYKPMSTSLFGAESTSTPVPPLSYVSTYKYRPLSERIPGSHAASSSDPPTTSESTSTYKPMSTSLFGAESTSAPVPPLSYVSTYKYRPLSERIPGSQATSSSDPPTTSGTTSTYKPMSTSSFGAESTSAPVPPLSTASTYKYRPLSERVPNSQGTSSSVPAPTSAFSSQPTSTSNLGSALSADQLQSLSQGGVLGTGIPGATSSGPGGLAARLNDPQIAQFRELIGRNPQLRQHFIQKLSQEHPELGQLFTQNPDLLSQFLDQMGQDEGASPAAQSARLSVTAVDQAAIERLEALGFPKQAVIEAYFACDKNEELAANYLLETA